MMAVKMALRSIGANKMRAALTMLGIIIGVMALVVLVSLVDSATSSITSEVSSLGSSLLTVRVTDDKGVPVKLQDLEAWVDTEPSIAAVAPYAASTATGKFGTESADFNVYGVTQDEYKIQSMQLTMGRFIAASDVKNSNRVCVIPEGTAEDLIGYKDCLGKEISLNGIKYTVVGVLEDEEESLATILSGGMKTAYIPYTSLMRLSTDNGSTISTFYIGAAEGYTLDQAEEVMKNLLLERFNEDDDAFSISSQNMIEEAMGRISNFLNILLGGIAAISLIVGGIGIMNIMLVTVTERTREIGIRKAIGASRRTILVQFLIEAVVLCMLGCALGIFVSWGILQIISAITASASISFRLNARVVLLSVLFCFLIGVIFGLYPANKAAKMKPIDALHYGG
ncbi:MAG: ABC transporter permease [Oscillospiraceae bacterium]|nr:ABC transporter permease [Oscillospiraceae bacterium]